MSTLKLLSQDATGVTYADPSDRNCTVRFKSTSASKSLNGVAATNYSTEIIYNDGVDVVVGGVNAVDALSVRLRTSGADVSKVRLKAILLSLAAQVDEWETEGVFAGFPPVTAPVIPAP